MDKFKILKSKHVVQAIICLVKDKTTYKTVFIHLVDNKEISIELDGTIKVVSGSDIYHIYCNGLLLNPDRINYEKIIKFKTILKGKNEVEKAKIMYSNIEFMRSLNSLEEKNGRMHVLKPVEINKRQVGYIMRGAINSSQGDHVKAYNKFISDLKKFNLTIITT